MSNLEFDEFIAKNYVSLMDYVIYHVREDKAHVLSVYGASHA